MRLNGLKEWGTIGGNPSGSFSGNFGRDYLDRDRSNEQLGVERATLIFATACLFFATAVIVLMLFVGR